MLLLLLLLQLLLLQTALNAKQLLYRTKRTPENRTCNFKAPMCIYVTRHTSHVTRYTSHDTHHTNNATAGLPKLSTASLWAPAASSARAHSTRPNCGAWGGFGCGGCVVEAMGEYLRSQVQSGRVISLGSFGSAPLAGETSEMR